MFWVSSQKEVVGTWKSKASRDVKTALKEILSFTQSCLMKTYMTSQGLSPQVANRDYVHLPRSV